MKRAGRGLRFLFHLHTKFENAFFARRKRFIFESLVKLGRGGLYTKRVITARQTLPQHEIRKRVLRIGKGEFLARFPVCNRYARLAQFQEIASFFKVLNFRDPNSVQLVRQNLEKYSPELHVLIKENEEEFNKLVKEPFNAKDLDYCNIVRDILPNPESNNMNQQLTPKQENKLGLTTKDIQAIRRLEEMGFDRGDVVQVYIMFGRDEERTADFLANNPK